MPVAITPACLYSCWITNFIHKHILASYIAIYSTGDRLWLLAVGYHSPYSHYGQLIDSILASGVYPIGYDSFIVCDWASYKSNNLSISEWRSKTILAS